MASEFELEEGDCWGWGLEDDEEEDEEDEEEEEEDDW
jgi:hypothetical protein